MSDEAPTKLTIKLATTDAAESAVATPEKAKRKRAPKKAAGEPAASRVKRGGVRSSIVAGPSSPHSSTQSSTKPTTSLPPAAQTATVASKSHGSYLPNMLLEHPSAPPVRRWTRSVRGIPSITGIPLKVKCWKGDPHSAYGDYLRPAIVPPPELPPSSLPPAVETLVQAVPSSTVATPNQLEAAASILAMSHVVPPAESPAALEEQATEDQEMKSVATQNEGSGDIVV